MIGSRNLADLATKIFECVAEYSGNLNNAELIMAHTVAAHIFMTVHEIEFEKQVKLLHACADLLAKNDPIRMVKLNPGDLIEPLVPPSAN